MVDRDQIARLDHVAMPGLPFTGQEGGIWAHGHGMLPLRYANIEKPLESGFGIDDVN